MTNKPRTGSGAGWTSFDLDIHTGRKTELVQSINRLVRRLNDINQPLVGANLELFPRLLVDVRASKNRVPLDAGRQRNWPVDNRLGSLGRFDDFFGRLIQYGVVVRFHTDPNSLTAHSRHQ